MARMWRTFPDALKRLEESSRFLSEWDDLINKKPPSRETSEAYCFDDFFYFSLLLTSDLSPSIRFLSLPRQSSLPTGPMAQL